MSEKLFVSNNELMKYSLELAHKIEKNDVKPDAIIGVSRGGCYPAIIIHEYLNYKNIECIYGNISVKSYDENNNKLEKEEIDISDKVLHELRQSNNIIIVDDVLDTGLTFTSIGNYLYSEAQITTNHFDFVSLYYKPNSNKTTIIPKFYINTTDKWIVFPHELIGLSNDDIKCKNYLL